MNYKNYFSLLLLVGAVLFFGAREAQACSCMATPTVLEAFEKAGNVVVTKVVSVEKSEKAAPPGRMSDGENYVNGVKSTRVIVEKVYKGTLKAGEELTFAQGGGADCIWTFSEENVGQQYLFYLGTREKNQTRWYAGTCGRSSGLSDAGDDLLYLDNLARVRGKTRLSGTLVANDGGDVKVEGRKIRITGAKKTYELKTNKHGVYEVYDLPAGRYFVEAEIPAGWKLSRYFGTGENRIPVDVEDRRHAGLNIYFVIDNAVRGKVYDPAGRPMKDVCLDLVPALVEPPPYFHEFDCTDPDGRFEISEVPPGNYYLVINKSGEINSDEPFKTFYYPDVSERERATIISLRAGETLEGYDVRVPRVEETVTVEGVFLYADGKPVVKERVEFKATTTRDNVEGDAGAQTDANGRFLLKVLKNFEGELYGEMYTYLGEFENCPKLEAIIKKSGGTSLEIKTDAIKFQGADDLRNVELRFSFPGCRKAEKQ